MMGLVRGLPIGFLIFLPLVVACSGDSAKTHYILAEKLWNEKNYEASVSEFERVTARDTNGKLGVQALYRAALTQALFLSQYSEALKKLEIFIRKSSDQALIWDAKLQMGDLLFSKLELYQQSLEFYQTLIKEKQDSPEIPYFQYRVAKSLFYLYQFQEAIHSFETLVKVYPSSPWAQKASFEIAMIYLTWGEQVQADDKKSDKILLTSKKTF